MIRTWRTHSVLATFPPELFTVAVETQRQEVRLQVAAAQPVAHTKLLHSVADVSAEQSGRHEPR